MSPRARWGTYLFQLPGASPGWAQALGQDPRAFRLGTPAARPGTLAEVEAKVLGGCGLCPGQQVGSVWRRWGRMGPRGAWMEKTHPGLGRRGKRERRGDGRNLGTKARNEGGQEQVGESEIPVPTGPVGTCRPHLARIIVMYLCAYLVLFCVAAPSACGSYRHRYQPEPPQWIQ